MHIRAKHEGHCPPERREQPGRRPGQFRPQISGRGGDEDGRADKAGGKKRGVRIGVGGGTGRGTRGTRREGGWGGVAKGWAKLVGGSSRRMKRNAEWQMDMLDETKKPVFRIRLVAETLA